ncbi:GNAT family N-acetyltransferase [Weissella coleopterorum]|uniref:GNAT family N-acetyltransferase n=1 Tax=Weissella coleopterorum TaxID=2714949 RepID=UPI001FEAB4CB|nr:GNAT family N-acetyltransferase [Weissella coleopterorum]
MNLLQEISRATFMETFGPYNSAENIEKYVQMAYHPEILKAEIANPLSQFFFILLNNQLAGYLKLNFGSAQSEPQTQNWMEVERIYVRQVFHQKGLGKSLMNYALEIGRKADKETVWLGVWEHNQTALQFYQSQGFSPFSEHIFELGGSAQRDLLLKYKLKGAK